MQWAHITDAEGVLADAIALPNVASKGRKGGRTIPLNAELKSALAVLPKGDGTVIRNRYGQPMRANSIAVWFHRHYAALGFKGASSHSGRRTFITRAARKIVEAGGSLRDVQQLAGHADLSMTARYIEGDNDAKRRVVADIGA